MKLEKFYQKLKEHGTLNAFILAVNKEANTEEAREKLWGEINAKIENAKYASSVLGTAFSWIESPQNGAYWVKMFREMEKRETEEAYERLSKIRHNKIKERVRVG